MSWDNRLDEVRRGLFQNCMLAVAENVVPANVVPENMVPENMAYDDVVDKVAENVVDNDGLVVETASVAEAHTNHNLVVVL